MAKFESKEHLVSLSVDEVYTILLLISRVAGDKECYDIYGKLEYILERELSLEDHDLLELIPEDEQEDWHIKIKQENE